MTDTRRFFGSVYLEDLNTINAPTLQFPYLRRNLRHALDRQNINLLLENGHDSAAEPATFSDNKASTKWDFPTTKMLNDVKKGTGPVMSIERLALRHTGSARVKPPHQRKELGRTGSPDWLPAEDEWKAPCQVSVRLQYKSTPKTSIFHMLKTGHILRHNHPTKDAAFEIVLEDPLKFELGDLGVFKEFQDNDGNNQWKLAREDDQCWLDIRVQCNNSYESAGLLSQLEGRDISEFRDSYAEDGTIRCAWHGLPDLPASGRLLDLKRSQRRKLIGMRYKAEVTMVWTQECQLLVAWNRAFQLQHEESHQLPTPSVSDDSERPRKMRVYYLHRRGAFQAKGATNSGLHCVMPHCRGQLEHSSLDRLMLHYAIHHDHMKFEVDASQSDGNSAVIFMGPAENISASVNSPNEKQEVEWQAPSSAFDIKAHLADTKPWKVQVRPLRNKDRSVHNTPQKSPRKRGHAVQVAPALRIPISPERLRGMVRKPEDVPDLPKVPRRKHKVPRVENVSFYRTLSKQLVPAGAEISDSEAEIDVEWAIQSQRRDQTVLGIDRATQDFNEVFNKHLDEEQPMSHLYTQDAVVRFARKYTPQLSEHKWKAQFQAKLKQFKDQNIINQSTVKYCMDLLKGPAAVETVRETTSGGRSSQALSGQGRFVRRDTESTPERGRAISPPSQLSTQSRMRWREGKVSQEEKNAANQAAHRSALSPTPGSHRRQVIPLGLRRVICRRGSQTFGPHHIADFLRDDKQDIAHHNIQPAELELAKFKRVLDDDLTLKNGVDVIVYIGNDMARPIVDESHWFEALQDIQESGSVGDIVFELRASDSLESLPKDNSSKRKRVDGADSPRKRVRSLENLCVCGSKAEDVRGTIACRNPKCPRKFHLRCLNLRQRPVSEWFCADCR